MSQAGKRWASVGFIMVGGIVGFASGSWAKDAPAAAAKESAKDLAIQDNMAVQLEYVLTADGAVVDSSEGRGPLRYVQGKGQIIPGLERQLAGLHAGDSREITVAPSEAYGPVDPAAFMDVPKTQLPAKADPKVGMVLQGKDPDGHPFRATIHAIKENAVTLNLNHPLAGKTLVFKIKVLDVSPAS